MSIDNQIIKYLKQHFEASPVEMLNEISVSRQMLHRVLHRMQEQGLVEKIGRPPKVYYKLKQKDEVSYKGIVELSEVQKNFLNEHFNLFTENGLELNGVAAFEKWCQKQKLPLEKTVNEFIATKEKYTAYIGKNGLIDGTDKLNNTKGFEKICIDKMYYGDFYAIERFGKTKLGNLLHYAKQGQSKKLMDIICLLIKERLDTLIKNKKIEAIGYIPPTIKREVQMMNYLQKKLNFSLPHVTIKKVSGLIPIPQKGLSKLDDRIANARSSIVVDDKRKFKKILLIDDAVGSGATINETACKIKFKKIAIEVIGFAVIGSYKGFDVIQDV